MKSRLIAAMVCYGMLAIGAATTLKGVYLGGVLVILGALAVKTWVGFRMQSHD